MRRVRVVLCVVSVTATSAASAGPATAGLNPNSVLEP
jgi:hypothetical protein